LQRPTERRGEDPNRECRKARVVPLRTAVFEECGQGRVFERIDKTIDGMTRTNGLLEFLNEFAG
jgi:hypothetical protein